MLFCHISEEVLSLTNFAVAFRGGAPAGNAFWTYFGLIEHVWQSEKESLALASMARDDPPASSTASGQHTAALLQAARRAAVLQARPPRTRGRVGSEFET